MGVPELFHISENTIPTLLKPRIMDYHSSKTGGESSVFTEKDIPHVSFGPSVYECFLGILPLVSEYVQSKEGLRDGICFNVYKAQPQQSTRFLPPSKLTELKYVWDAHVTNEYWCLDQVNVLYCGGVRIDYDPSFDWVSFLPYDEKGIKMKLSLPPMEAIKIRQILRVKGPKHRMKLFP